MKRKEYTMTKESEIVRALQEANKAIETLQGAYEVMSALAEARKEEIESLQAQLLQKTQELTDYTATGLIPGDVKDLQALCKENGLAKYVDLIVEAKRQMGKSNEQSIEQGERIEQLEAQLAASQRRERAAVEDIMCSDHCDVCVYKDSGTSCALVDFDCADCDDPVCVCRCCRDEDKWQWRGPVAGRGEAE